jgi:hypothetical protein
MSLRHDFKHGVVIRTGKERLILRVMHSQRDGETT